MSLTVKRLVDTINVLTFQLAITLVITEYVTLHLRETPKIFIQFIPSWALSTKCLLYTTLNKTMVSMNFLVVIHDTARQQPQTSWHNQSSYLRWTLGGYYSTARKVRLNCSFSKHDRNHSLPSLHYIKGMLLTAALFCVKRQATRHLREGFPRQLHWKEQSLIELAWLGVIVLWFTKISQSLYFI